MKKTIIALLLVFILAVGLIGFFGMRSPRAGVIGGADGPTGIVVSEAQPAEAAPVEAAASAPAEEAAPETTEEAETFTVRTPDYAAMYALHDPEEIVARVDGQDVSWGEYFYLYFSQAKQLENYFNSMASYYGAAPDWADQVEEDSDKSFADMVADSADETLKQIRAIEGMSEQAGVELTDEQLEAIRAQEEQDILGALGEGKTAEDFNA